MSSEPAPIPNAIGIIATSEHTVVMTIGRMRTAPVGGGLGQIERGGSALDLRFELAGVDLCECLSLADVVALLDAHVEQGARHESIYANGAEWVEDSRDRRGASERAAVDGRYLDRRRPLVRAVPAAIGPASGATIFGASPAGVPAACGEDR